MSAPVTVVVPEGTTSRPNGAAGLIGAARSAHPERGLQIVAVAPAADRQGCQVVTLGEDAPESWDVSEAVASWDAKGAAEAVDRVLREAGARLAEWAPLERRARACWAGSFDTAVRDRLAGAYGVGGSPWEVDVRCIWGADGLPQSYEVIRHPGGRDATAALYSLPGVAAWWALSEGSWDGRIVLERRDQPKLPATVPLADLLPDSLDPADWTRLPLGVGPDGEVVSLDLELGPHAILVGPPGSGKSVGINCLAAGALMRGFDVVVVVDPSKGRTDFGALAPWISAWGTDSMAQVRETLQAVYAEGTRRRQILARHGADRWDRLPADVRERERVRPLLLIVDEASSLLVMPDSKVVNGLEKDSDEQLEMKQLVADTTMTHYLLGKLAREMRFVGIHLVIATQRPDAAIIGGELRSLLSSAVQLSPPKNPVSKTALGMLFAGDQIDEAHTALAAFGDPPTPGLAVTAGEGGGVSVMRVGYEPTATLAALLRSRGVPTATQWGVEAMSDAVEDELEAEVEELDLGTVDLNWDDAAFADAASADRAIPWGDELATPSAHREETNATGGLSW